MKQKKFCSNCVKGMPISINKDILCRERGVVSPDYVCSKHRFMPEPKTYRDLNYKCIECSFFTVEEADQENSPTLGLCQLFSVRKYDGSLKSACSKFSKHMQDKVC